MGPKDCKCYLHCAIWIFRVSVLINKAASIYIRPPEKIMLSLRLHQRGGSSRIGVPLEEFTTNCHHYEEPIYLYYTSIVWHLQLPAKFEVLSS